MSHPTESSLTPTPAADESFYTDRSRYKLCTSRCARARFLGNHAGDTGYGLTAVRESLPLATGINFHGGVETCAKLMHRHGRLPELDEMRGIIADNVAEYLGRVDARGYRGILGSEATAETIREQCTLIAALLWVLRLKFLPWLFANYLIVAVEQERLHRLGGDRAIMLRTDLLAKRRGGQSLAYFEFKTTGFGGDTWAEQWETDPQLALGTVDARELWGEDVNELYVVGMFKGPRQRDRYAEGGGDADQRRKQMTPLCYGYRRPGNPPLQLEDWLPAHEWVDDQGVVKRASRLHKRTPVWQLTESDWPTWRAYQAANPGMDATEFWTRMLPPSLLDKVCTILGPMNKQDHQLQALLRNIDGEEARWQETLWRLYELQTEHGWTWKDEGYQEALDRLVPCSWNCRPFGREAECEFVKICHRHQGWDDPVGSGAYRPRLPHHEPELRQAIARGLLPAEAAEQPEED